MKKISQLWIFIVSLLIVSSCQAVSFEQEEQAAPPWVTPATSTAHAPSTSLPNPTRTPLIIPERTSVSFRSVNQLSDHIGSEDALFDQTEVFVLTSAGDIAEIEDTITPDDRENLENLDFNSMMVVALYGQNTRDLGDTLKIRMVFQLADTIQVYAVNESSGFSIDVPAGEDGVSLILHPYHIIQFDKENLPDIVAVEVYLDSELIEEAQINIR
jgi:hypothetical protein